MELVRGIKEEELEEVFHLVELGYLRREHPYPNAGEELRQETTEPGYQLENHRIVEKEGQIVAHAIAVFHDITYGSAVVPAGSVGSVVSHPDYRGQHLGQKVMAGMVDYMKKKGRCVAFLGTGSLEFYRKLGWEFIGLEEIFNMNPVSFDKLEVRNFEPGYLEKIKSLYAESIEGKFGYIIRDYERWQRLADVPQYTFLVDGEVGAYGILHQYFGTPALTFGEVLGRSREGQTEVIKAALHEAQKRGASKLHLRLEKDSPTASLVDDEFSQFIVEHRTAPGNMWRIINLHGFIEAVTGELGHKARRSTRVRIETEESDICIQTEKGKVAVVDDASVTFHTSVNTLTQILLGQMTAGEASQKGLARINPEGAGETVVILDEIFPPTHPFQYLTGR